MSTPSHNTTALTIGTTEFSFAEGATNPATAFAAGYIDFGNIVSCAPKVETKTESHKGSYRGVKRVDRVFTTETMMSYTLTVDEMNVRNLAVIFGAGDGVNRVQNALSAANGDAFGFTVGSPSSALKWYDLRVSGVVVSNITTVTISGLTEGTHFEVDKVLGRIRFLADQTVTRVPVITAGAITASSPWFANGLKPLEEVRRSGYGRITLFDNTVEASNPVVLDHREFACELVCKSVGTIDGDKVITAEFELTVLADTGNLLVRGANA